MLHEGVRSNGLDNKIDRSKGVATVNLSEVASHDRTASLSDKIMLQILGHVDDNPNPCFLVCKRWLQLQGILRKSISAKEWTFLESGRMVSRFPNLVDVDLSGAWLSLPAKQFTGITFTHGFINVQLEPYAYFPTCIESFIEKQQISLSSFDRGLGVLADGCPSLQRLCLVDVRRPTYNPSAFRNRSQMQTEVKYCTATESAKHQTIHDTMTNGNHANGEKDVKKSIHIEPFPNCGLAYLAKKCATLQELILHNCTDDTLSAISSCQNLQILHLVGIVSVFYHCTFADAGLTILANRCRRLVKLELSGSVASYDGIVAIAKCCIMLEELIISDQNFLEGWIGALSYCSCLKKLRLENCKNIDLNPGPIEDLYSCVALHQLELVRCNVRDKAGFSALIVIASFIKELLFQDCWGLDDETMGLAKSLRELRVFSLEGCHVLTTAGLESVVATWKDLQTLHVVHCSSIKDSEIGSTLALVFSNLKVLKWRPDMSAIHAGK